MSKELNKTYDPKDIEDRLYKKWEDNGYFHAEVDRSKKPFTIVMPPPNITGQLHMGHALDNTMQDILIRYKRMQGYNALWQPGTDHAAIATEVKVIEHLKEQNINEISGGELQLVYIARALCSHPKVLILDEAETGLDMANQIVVLDLLKRLSKEKGLMIIFNTHYPQHALDIADQTLLLSKEGTSLFGNTDQILTEENLSRVFHVPVIQLEKKMNGKTYHSLIAVSKNESI